MAILLALIIIAILFIVIIAGIPNDFAVCRSTKISAPPEKIFPHVNDLHAWDAWSPWAKLDPNCQYKFEGPATGPGSVMSWDGNKKVGAGRMTVLETRASNLVRFKLEFFRPFAGTNMSEFRFEPEDRQTDVQWTMTGKTNPIFKIVGLFMSCDNMVGKDFAKGLAQLKSVAEKQ
ncbi:MAG: polyketide cyclase [Verrucomicrobiales bacterium]|nr:polyketide cyclase [Verrucomicrobiales bacterium]